MVEDRNLYVAPNQHHIEYRCTHCEWFFILDEQQRRKSIDAAAEVRRQFRDHDCKDKPKKAKYSG